MNETCNDKTADEIGRNVMELLIMLYENQTGKKYEYSQIHTGNKHSLNLD